jgi:hypothetical protein
MLVLSDVNETWIFSTEFPLPPPQEMFEHQISLKILPVEAK